MLGVCTEGYLHIHFFTHKLLLGPGLLAALWCLQLCHKTEHLMFLLKPPVVTRIFEDFKRQQTKTEQPQKRRIST